MFGPSVSCWDRVAFDSPFIRPTTRRLGRDFSLARGSLGMGKADALVELAASV
jgi:hypothetical protein